MPAADGCCGTVDARHPGLPRLLTMRAFHDTSRTGSVRSLCPGSIERSSIVLAVRRLSSFTNTSASVVLTTTRSPRRMEAAGDTMTRVPSLYIGAIESPEISSA